MKQNGGNANNKDDREYKDNCSTTPWPLKVRKDSHMKQKSSSPIPFALGSVSSLSGIAAPKPLQQRAPVIIYTHSPKVIHTNPKDFMSLVQKLTGMSPSDGPNSHNNGSNRKRIRTREPYMRNEERNPYDNTKCTYGVQNEVLGNNNDSNNDDNESSSVITDENCSNSNIGDVVVRRLSPYVGNLLFDPTSTPPSSQSLPNFYDMPNSTSDLLSYNGDIPLYDYMDFNFSYN